MGLPREMRLRRHADFTHVAQQGRGRANGLVVVRFAPNSLPSSRCGFSVSKRVGSAVHRNLTKRRLLEAARDSALVPGFDLVFIARPDARTASYAVVRAAVADVLQRAGLLQSSKISRGSDAATVPNLEPARP